MIQATTALYDFFSSFGIPAYVTDNIPDNVKMPYITYDIIDLKPLARGMLNASVWYRDTSFSSVIAKVDQIKAAIGTGISLKTESGSVILKQETSGAFCLLTSDPNPETKRAYLSMVMIANTD